MINDIVRAIVMEPYRLRLKFEDGIEGDVDLQDLVEFVGVFEALKNVVFFNEVRVDPDLGTVVWPNGADLDPLVLYSHITGGEIVF